MSCRSVSLPPVSGCVFAVRSLRLAVRSLQLNGAARRTRTCLMINPVYSRTPLPDRARAALVPAPQGEGNQKPYTDH